MTPLLVAAEHGHGAIVKALLEYGAPVRVADATGRTALHYAAIGGFRRTARILLNHPDVEPRLADGAGETPFDLAKSHGYEVLTKLLEAC